MRAFAIGFIFLTGTVHGAAAPDFRKDVRPILSDNCFQCHGNDRTTRMAGLRLDTRDGAFSARKNGAPIVAGNPTKSLILQRITAKNPARRMPPPFAHKTLTPAQIDTLTKWIQAGAPWQEHWAFTAPVRPALPSVKNASWPRNPIDRFILARLEQNGLSPAPEAGRRTLIRRLSLDLTGLPPDPADVEDFAASTDAQAYDALIEKYLASPRYGEQRARFWLDAARYADTHGIHIDNYREMWPYRDWVIRAYNANMPFDRFILEQLAGDLLPNPTLEQRIATGFQRCNATTNEAGVIIEEIEAMYAKDRADTIGAVFLGLTVGCATCHDHKFDPIPQKDFYALTAFFRNTTQNAMDGNVFDTPPIVVVPRAEDRARWDAIEAREKVLRALLKSSAGRAGQAGAPAGRDLLRLSLDGAITTETPQGRLNLPFPAGLALGGANHPNQYAIYFRKASLELPNIPEIDTNAPFSVATTFFYPKGEEYYLIAAQQDPKDKGRGWNLFVSARIPGARFYFDQGKSIEIRAGHLDQLVPGTWNTLEMHYDGTGEALGVRLVLNGREVNPQRNSRAKFEGSIRNAAPLKLGNPTRSEDGAIAELRVYQPTLSPEEAELHRLELEKREIRRRGAITHVMEERTDQKPFAHRLYRGMYDAPRERLDANTPSVLPPMAPELPRNRLGLAQWLTSPEHPLTARVTVNRYWQEIFGAGLVKTSEDFGSQGEAPVNQELLDWLAVEFRESGWDTKHMLRLLVSSAAYRQSAEATPGKLEKDPQNRLLSRGPRFRLDAETIRDSALAAAGLLVPAIGGPSVKPYQPEGVWEAVAMDSSDTRFYKQDHGESLYRRSLYTFWKRSAPPASMEIFNAPTRETCTVRRERTNTPLQALVVMNDPQFVEAARALAARAMASPGIDTRLNDISRRLLSRRLEPRELDILKSSYRDFLRYYDSNPAEARKLIAVGESKPPENLNVSELASMTMVASQLLNLDEALNK
jgi:hypothetical protein